MRKHMSKILALMLFIGVAQMLSACVIEDDHYHHHYWHDDYHR